MVSLTRNTSSPGLDSLGTTNSTSASSTSSADSTSSFEQQLESAVEAALSQSGNGSQIQITVQQQQGQNSGGSQFLVTLTVPPSTSSAAAATSSSAASAAASAPANTMPFFQYQAPSSNTPAATASTPAATSTPATSNATASDATSATAPVSQASEFTEWDGMTITTLQTQIQSTIDMWQNEPPELAAASLANGGTIAPPTTQVPGTTMTFGDLNQIKQLAYMYGTDFGTGGLSMQDFLTQNAGPNASWNVSYNQIQADPQLVQAAVS